MIRYLAVAILFPVISQATPMLSDDLKEKAKLMLIRDETRPDLPLTKVYRCPSGKLTFGIGHNIEDNGVSLATVYQTFYEDLAEAEKGLYNIFNKEWFHDQTDERQLALINLIFNLGEARFRKFAPTIALMKEGRWKEASERILKSLYAKQVGKRAQRVALMLSESEFPYS